MAISEDKIAAAQIASIFGSEILNIKSKAVDGGTTTSFAVADPKAILLGGQRPSPGANAIEQRILQELQREAEAACPIPVELAQSSVATEPSSQQEITVGSVVPVSQPVYNTGGVTIVEPVMERIAQSLERIAARLESVDVLLKKRKITRRKS